MGSELFQRVLKAVPARQLREQLGSVAGFSFITRSAQPFFAATTHHAVPDRPLVVVVEGLKSQETFHHELEVWFRESAGTKDSEKKSEDARPLFFPAWEVMPHESRLPHADIISERLETLLRVA